MKLSDAIEIGAARLKTPGPTALNDCWNAAASGMLGRVATADEVRELVLDNPWRIKQCGDLEYWLRLTVVERYRWHVVVSKLRGYGA